MPNSPLEELMIDQLRDIYDAEKQLTKVLPRLAKAASDDELAEGFRMHAQQTQEQASRIEQVFEALGIKAKGKPCEAMKGLIAEAQEVLSEDMEEGVMDVALIASARRVEHYEIAAYDSMVMVAQTLKQTNAVGLFKQTLAEETQMDKTLVGIAKRIAKEAAKPAPQEEEEEPTSGGARSKGSAKTSTRKAFAKSSGGGRNASAKSQGSGSGRSASKRSSGGGNSHSSNTTTDHDQIREWAEARGGKPSCVQGTGGKGDIGLLRIEFPGKPNAKDDKLTEIGWDDFFEKFDERNLALVYQEQTAAGEQSNFNKLVAREEGSSGKGKGRAAR